jgi:cytochrome oxidase Cu insertion factor (SCO1/SenC/PrrC family)
MKYWRIWLILASIVIGGTIVFFSSTSFRGAQPYEGTELSGIAPDFKLTDQNSRSVALSDFRGKVVVLTFFDSRCTDICPLTAVQLLQAYKQLNQNQASQVVFLGVNVSVHFNNVADVLDATQRWHLDEIPNWHFLTGAEEDLISIWNAYGVSVVPHEDEEIIHTPGVFLIDLAGQKRWYISTPYSKDGNAEWTLPLSELLVNHIREMISDT